MVIIDSADFYEVRVMEEVSSRGFESLNVCYLPIIGMEAVAAFSLLYYDPTRRDASKLCKREDMLRRTGLTSGQFQRAMQALEAVGLVRSFVKKGEGASYYVHCIFSPVDISSFLNDPLLGGMLEKTLGHEKLEQIKIDHRVASLPTDMEEVTEKFSDFFNPSFKSAIQNHPETVGKAWANVPLTFSLTKFEDEIRQLGVNPNSLSIAEKERVAKMAELYQLNESSMASYVFDAFEPAKVKGNRLNRRKLSELCQDSLRFTYIRVTYEKSEVSGKGAKAEKIQMMDEINPIVFLSMVQGGHRPPEADLQLIETLSGLGLTYPCINVLLDFVLQKKNNTLPAAYCEKIAGTLVREGCQTARDAMDCLYRINAENKARKPYKNYAKPSQNPDNRPADTKLKETVTDEEIDSLLDSLDEDE